MTYDGAVRAGKSSHSFESEVWNVPAKLGYPKTAVFNLKVNTGVRHRWKLTQEGFSYGADATVHAFQRSPCKILMNQTVGEGRDEVCTQEV